MVGESLSLNFRKRLKLHISYASERQTMSPQLLCDHKRFVRNLSIFSESISDALVDIFKVLDKIIQPVWSSNHIFWTIGQL